MSTLFLCVGCFCAGWVFGGMLLVWEAFRPQGYKANNGNRYRLTRVL